MKRLLTKRLSMITLMTVTLVKIHGCSTKPDASALDASTRDYDGEQGMEPGRGYGGVFEDARGVCVTFDAAQTTGQGQETVFQLQMIENHQDLSAKLNISSASQVKAAVPDTPATVSAKTKFALNSSLTINKYSVYALVSTVVKNETTHLQNVRLKDEQLALITDENAGGAATEANIGANSTIDRFRVQCGDEFMGAYTTGGEFFGIVEVKTHSREEQLTVSRELSANIGIEQIGTVGNQSAIQATLSRVTRNREFRIWTFQRGGSGETSNPVATVDDMITRARSMPTIVQNPEHARILTGTFHDYLTLPIGLPSSYQPALIKARQTIQVLGRMQAGMLDVRANIDYITMHPEQFNGISGAYLADLTTTRTEIDRRMEKVYKVAQGCYTDFTKCDIPADLKTPEFTEPERIRPQTDPEKFAFQVQPTFVDKKKLADWFSQGECYIKIIVKGNDTAEVTIARSETYDNCELPSLNMDVDKERVISAFTSLGIRPEDGWFSVELYEADSYNDDFIGNATILYSSVMSRGTVRGQISNDKAVINVNASHR